MIEGSVIYPNEFIIVLYDLYKISDVRKWGCFKFSFLLNAILIAVDPNVIAFTGICQFYEYEYPEQSG